MPRLQTCTVSATDRNVLVAPTQHANPKLAAWRQRMRSVQASAAPVQATCSSAPKRPVSQQLLAGLAATAVSLQLGGPAMGFTTGEPVPLPLMMEQQQVPVVSQLGLYEQPQEDFMSAPALAAPSLEDVLVPTSLLTDLESVADSAFIDSLKSVVEDSISATNLAEANFTAVGASPSNGSRWMSQGPLCYVWEAYCSSLTERPMFTKMLTGMLGTLLGDLLAQGLAAATSSSSDGDAATSSSAASNSRSSTAGAKGGSASKAAAAQKQAPGLPSLDWGRTARLVGYSALVGTPLAALWYNFLDASVFPADPTAPAAIVAKMALDQLVNAPIMTSVFFAAMCLVEGRPGDALQDVRTKLKPTLMASYCLWPLAHVINFGFIDPQNRILYINSINIGWTAFMSHMASSSKDASSTEQPAAAPARALSARTVSSRS